MPEPKHYHPHSLDSARQFLTGLTRPEQSGQSHTDLEARTNDEGTSAMSKDAALARRLRERARLLRTEAGTLETRADQLDPSSAPRSSERGGTADNAEHRAASSAMEEFDTCSRCGSDLRQQSRLVYDRATSNDVDGNGPKTVVVGTFEPLL
jgi:hypothetical protein